MEAAANGESERREWWKNVGVAVVLAVLVGHVPSKVIRSNIML